LKNGYRLIRTLRSDGDLPFDVTTIVEDNTPARRVLNAGLADLPRYQEAARFTTFIVPLWRRLRPVDTGALAIEPGSVDRLPEIAACLQRNATRFQFAPAWTVDDLASPERSRGLLPADFLLACEAGRVVGCLALWDQSSFKQIVIRGYGPSTRRWRPVVNGCARILGLPRLPAPGSAVPHVFVSHVAVDDDRADVFRALFAAACNRAHGRGLTCLVAGFADRHPLASVLRGVSRAWTYSSIIYTVHWDDRPLAEPLDGRIPHLEVALL
jgi:hypothetical protein